MSEEVIPMTTEENQQPENEAPKKRRGKQPKYDTNYSRPGRPPRSPKRKVGRPIRYLVTIGVEKAVNEIAEKEMLLVSDVQRLALYRFMKEWYKQQGLEFPTDLENDSTFDTLRGQGYI